MKKLVSMYQKYMFRPILYKSVTRVSVVAVLMLLWDRYVSDGTFTIRQNTTPSSRPRPCCWVLCCWRGRG